MCILYEACETLLLFDETFRLKKLVIGSFVASIEWQLPREACQMVRYIGAGIMRRIWNDHALDWIELPVECC